MKKIISVVCLFAILGTSAFASSATIPSAGENKYKAVRLTPEIYNNANPDLSDILVKDESGKNLPYFISDGSPASQINDTQVYPMSLINAYTKNDKFYFDYQLSGSLDRDVLATSIEISARDVTFAKNIEIYGGYDNINWEHVQSDTIYNVDGKSKLTIDFNAPEKYTFYRFELDNNLEMISFQAVDLVYSVSRQERGYFVESLTPAFTVEEKDRETHVSIAGLRNLRLKDVTIHTQSMFQRMVSAPNGIRKELYNLSFNDTAFTDTTIPFNWKIAGESDLILTIQNGDDNPISIDSVTVEYYADEVVFEDNGSAVYSLHFGRDESKTAPVYDIVKYKDRILKTDIDKLPISGISFDGAQEEMPKPFDFKPIFNIVIIVVAVLLGISILVKLKK